MNVNETVDKNVNRPVDYDVVEIAGHTVVAPTLSGYISDDLARPLEEYFPNNDPALWFSWTLEEQNKWVVERMFAGRCAVVGLPRPGEYVGAHHIIQRSIAHEAARVPWNAIPVMHSPDEKRNIHGLLHPDNGCGLEIVHWDMLDPKNGLAIIDRRDGGHRVPNGELEFYQMPSTDKAAAATEWIRQCLAVYRQFVQCEYQMGALAAIGEEQAVVLGHKGVKACMSEYGMDAAPFVLGAKVADELTAFWQDGKDACVTMRVMDMIRKLPEDQQKPLFDLAKEKCAPLDLDNPADHRHPSFADWVAEKKAAAPPKNNPVKCTVFDSGVEYEETELTPEEIAGTSKLVVKGSPIKKF